MKTSQKVDLKTRNKIQDTSEGKTCNILEDHSSQKKYSNHANPISRTRTFAPTTHQVDTGPHLKT